MFICGLSPNQIKELKQAKKAMEEKLQKLEGQLNNNKIFLNMVIHDMRNPSNAAEFGMQESLKLIDEALREYR